MVKALLALLRLLYTAPVLELVGAAAVVVAVGLLASWLWALLAAGIALLLKSLDLDHSAEKKS